MAAKKKVAAKKTTKKAAPKKKVAAKKKRAQSHLFHLRKYPAKAGYFLFSLMAVMIPKIPVLC